MIMMVLVLAAVVTVRAEEEPQRFSIWDFKSASPTYGYERWQDLGAVGKSGEKGWTLDGSAAGGFGLIYHQLLDLEGAGKLRLVVEVNDGHSDGQLLVKLHTADEKFAAWTIPLADKAPGQEHVLVLDLDAPQDRSKPEGPDMGIIQQIQVQGSFNPGARVHLTFKRLEAEVRTTAP